MARKAPRTSALAIERHALLGDVLHMGALAFLTLRDTAVVLNCCCSALRNDSQLALMVLLETGPFATGDRTLDIRAGHDCDAKIARLFEKCGEDEHFVDNAATGAVNSSAKAPRDRCCSNPLRNMDDSQFPWFFAQLLSLIAAFDKFVLPLLPEKKKTNVDTSVPYWSDENIHCVPMTIALSLYLPKRQETQQDWTRDDVRKALNAYIGKLGNSFLNKPFQKAAATRFGTHWGCITPASTSTTSNISDSADASFEAIIAATQSHFCVKCDLCEKTNAAMQYAEANRGCMEDLYTQTIRNELVEGGFSAQEIADQLHQLDRHSEYDLQGDELLVHVLRQDLVDLPRVAFTNRIYFHRILKKIPAVWEISGFKYSKAELIGGVSRSGFFIGAVVITY